MIRKEMIQMVEFTETFIPNILMMLQVCYKKILKINLTENRYSLVYINNDEKETYEHVNKELNIAVYKLLQSIHNRDFEFRIASIGTAFGNSRNIKEIIQKAEEKMYEDKKEFYKIHPEYDARIKRFNA